MSIHFKEGENREVFRITDTSNKSVKTYSLSPIIINSSKQTDSNIPLPVPVSMGGTGSTTIAGIKNVLGISQTQPQVLPQGNNGDILVYNAVSKLWEARSATSGGGSILEDGSPDTNPGGVGLDLNGGSF